MSNDLQKFFGNHAQPDRAKLAESLAGLSAAKQALSGNQALLRLTKQGVWVFGADSVALKPGTQLIADPASLSSGYVAWYMAKPEAEVMQPTSLGPVDPSKLPEVNSGSIPPGAKKPSGKGWEPQFSIALLTRDKIPLSLLFKTSSVGGSNCLLGLAGEIAMGLAENEARVYPIIEPGVDSYQHKEFGEVFTPTLTVVGWLGADGQEVKDLTKLGKDGLL